MFLAVPGRGDSPRNVAKEEEMQEMAAPESGFASMVVPLAEPGMK